MIISAHPGMIISALHGMIISAHPGMMSDILGMDHSRLGCADDLAQRLHAMERRAGGRQGEAMVEIAR